MVLAPSLGKIPSKYVFCDCILHPQQRLVRWGWGGVLYHIKEGQGTVISGYLTQLPLYEWGN